YYLFLFFFFSSRRRHTRSKRDWSSDVCSSDLAFSMWIAGAGVRGGQAIGSTDELGFEGVQDPYHVSDLHATLLHLMGFDHRRLKIGRASCRERVVMSEVAGS